MYQGYGVYTEYLEREDNCTFLLDHLKKISRSRDTLLNMNALLAYFNITVPRKKLL